MTCDAKRSLLAVFMALTFWLGGCAITAKPLDAAGRPKRHLWDYKKTHFNMYSLQEDIRLGTEVQQAQQEAFEKKRFAVDPPEHAKTRARIEAVVKRLAKVSDIPSLPYEVHIYDKPEVANAFCLPGGKIGVFTGLFDKDKGLIDPKSDDELAAVLGHEIAHATLRHVSRRLTTYNGFQVVGGIISLGIGGAGGGAWQGAFSQVFSTGTALYLPTYSRAHETEADQVGFYYMVQAGYDPQAAIRVWEHAADKRAREGKPDKTSFFSTHPASRERAAVLKAYLPDVADVKTRMKMIEESKKER